MMIDFTDDIKRGEQAATNRKKQDQNNSQHQEQTNGISENLKSYLGTLSSEDAMDQAVNEVYQGLNRLAPPND